MVSLNACLNTENKTAVRTFDTMPYVGGVVDEMLPQHKKAINSKWAKVEVQCFPFFSVMKAIKRKHIDFFSLDVEGAEMGILKTIPFSELIIDVILVEYQVRNSNAAGRQRYREIFNLMAGTGLYEFVGTHYNLDMLFVRKSNITQHKLAKWRKKLGR